MDDKRWLRATPRASVDRVACRARKPDEQSDGRNVPLPGESAAPPVRRSAEVVPGASSPIAAVHIREAARIGRPTYS